MKYIQLGKIGDIYSLAPLLYHEFLKTGEKQQLVVAEQFASCLEGFSYIEPLIFRGSFTALEEAIKQFKGTPTQVLGSGEFISTQIYGKGVSIPQSCDSFQKESWRLAGKLDQWRFQHPLVFDKRNKEREEALLAKYTKQFKKPRWIVVADGGTSSPFPHRELLRHLLELQFNRTCNIVFLSDIKAERFFDILSVIDNPKTRCIVATDSAPLHLAYATQKPTFALIADRPSLWHGSSYRANHVRYTRYSKFPEYAVDFMECIADVLKPGVFNLNSQRIIHAYSQYPCNEETRKRNDFAKDTWKAEYEKSGRWFSTPITESHVTRSSKDLVGEGKAFPVVGDLLRATALRAKEDDIIVYSNSDTCFVPGITQDIVDACEKHGGCHAHRRDFPELRKPLARIDLQKGVHYPGSDLFAFTKPFLRKILPEFGDYILAHEAFDRILRELIIKHGGAELKNVIYHKVHQNNWSQRGVRENDPINRHNRRLAVAWLKANNLHLEELASLPA